MEPNKVDFSPRRHFSGGVVKWVHNPLRWREQTLDPRGAGEFGIWGQNIEEKNNTETGLWSWNGGPASVWVNTSLRAACPLGARLANNGSGKLQGKHRGTVSRIPTLELPGQGGRLLGPCLRDAAGRTQVSSEGAMLFACWVFVKLLDVCQSDSEKRFPT